MAFEHAVYEIERSDLFRAYARICELQRKNANGEPMMPSELMQSAARCFRFVADAIERCDPHLPAEWRS